MPRHQSGLWTRVLITLLALGAPAGAHAQTPAIPPSEPELTHVRSDERQSLEDAGPRVLILSSYERYTASARGQEDAIRAAIEKDFPRAIIRSDYLVSADLSHLRIKSDLKRQLAGPLRAKYAGPNSAADTPDLVITIDTLAFDLATDPEVNIFSGIPLVFSGVYWTADMVRARRAESTGVLEHLDIAGTVDLILRQRPGVRKVFVVACGSPYADLLLSVARAKLDLLADRITYTASTARMPEDLRTELRALTPEWAILYLKFDARGSSDFVPERDIDWPVPAYACFANHVGHTIVGGSVIHPPTEGRSAGEIAVRVLSGKKPGDLPISESGARVVMLDSGMLVRWGIPGSTIPEGAIVVNRPRPWMERNSRLLGWVGALAALQSAMLGLLWASRRRLRRTETQLARQRDQLELVINGSDDGFWDYDLATGSAFLSRRIHDMLGITGEVQNPTQALRERLHPDDVPRAEAALAAHLDHHAPFHIECRLRAAEGMDRWFLVRGEAVRDAYGQPVRMAGSLSDIDERLRAARARDGQRRVLELIATGTPLERVLEEIARMVQEQQPGVLTSILLLNDDGRTVRTAAAPSLPAGYSHAIDGMRIGPGVGSCGTAMHTGQRVIVRDIATDPLWVDFKDLALAHGLRACWSEPIRSHAGTVLGAFAMYAAAPRSPEESELELIASAAQLAGIALDNAASREALIRDRRIFLQGPAIAWRWRNAPGWPVEFVTANIATLGYTPEDFTSGRILFADVIHPEDLPRISAEVAGHIAAGLTICNIEYRARTADGRWVWMVEHSLIERDSAGQVTHLAGYTVDDTARRESDAVAREERERYRQIVETAQEGVWVVDGAWKTTLVNASMAQMLGYEPGEMIGKDLFDFMDDAGAMEARRHSLRREDGSRERHDFRFRHRSGRDVWTLVSTNDLRDGTGGFAGALAMVTDITDRKRAEAALAASAERYRLIIEAAGAGIFDWDLVTGQCYISTDIRELMSMEGVAPEDIVPRWRMLLHPEDRPGVERLLEASTTLGTVYDTEYRLRVAAGHYLWIRARGNTIRDGAGRLVRMVGSLQNIDASKRVDLALRENEQRLSLLVQRTPLAVIHWDTEFRVTQWNPAAEAIFGWSAAEAIGQDGRLIVPERDRSYVEKVIEDLLAKRGGERGTNQNLTKDGRTVFCEWYNTALIGPDGNVLGIASIGEDVTLERDAQRHQQLIMAELDHRVKNTLAAVISLAEQTGRSSTTYKDFLASLLGRIRTLERMHSVLANQRWQGADLFDLVRATIEAFGHHASNLSSIEGPRVTLPPRTAQAVAMALNELATNAAKYGALSQPGGGIAVAWQLVGTLPAPTLTLTWTEHGGPPVTPPTKRGFGTELIEGGLAHELGGTADIEFDPRGVRARFVVPLTPDPAPAPTHPTTPILGTTEPIADNPAPPPSPTPVAAEIRS